MSAPLTASWLVTSGPGVTIAPTTNASTVAQRPNFRSCFGVTMFARTRNAMKSGSSKTAPNAEEEARREVEEELERHDLRELDARSHDRPEEREEVVERERERDVVRERDARQEERRREEDERNDEPLLLLVEPGRDERPELVEDDRRGDDDRPP